MSKYYVYNGQFYSEDELMHWKYIKREKKNGRWMYYYDESELNKASAAVKSSQDNKTQASESLRTSERDRDKYAEELKVAKDFFGEDSGIYKESQAIAAEKEAQVKKAANRAKKAAVQAKIATKKYEVEKIKSFAAKTIAKGLNKVSNLLSNLFSKKK